MAKYIAQNYLERQQNKLNLDLISYDLDEAWQSHELIQELRRKLYHRMPAGLFDPQDLEHQVLFRLTTYDPADITDEVIDATIAEQRLVIENRLKDVADKAYLFRGLDPRSKDLNATHRLELKRDGERLYATSPERTLEVEFRKIKDDELIRLFTEKLHYIHNGRHSGDAFAFFFAGDDIPWGIETTELSIGVKPYKREALLAHGIDPNKAVEITRLYLLPGSPKNAISILDGQVAKYYKELGMEAMYTTTMPAYAKTKGATTSGGMNKVLLVKEQTHAFRRQIIDGKTAYVHDVTAVGRPSAMHTHNMFPTIPTVETYMRLNDNRDIKPLSLLDRKTIFVNQSSRRSAAATETRFELTSVSDTLDTIKRHNGVFLGESYIFDTFWGHQDQPKLRLRRLTTTGKTLYEASSKYRLSAEQHVRIMVNDNLYRGTSQANAVSAIKLINDNYEPENSYEKIRMRYKLDDVYANIDIYPFGAYLKLKGDVSCIWKVAKLFGFNKEDAIVKNADDIYLDWAKQMKLAENWSVRFGLKEASGGKS